MSIFLLEQQTVAQFSNVFHLYSSKNSQSILPEVKRILDSLKVDILCLFDHTQDKEELKMKRDHVLTVFKKKIKEFYCVDCPEDVALLISQILESYQAELKIFPQVKTVPNCWNQAMRDIDQCFCEKDDQSILKEICYKCNKFYHPNCFWARQAEKQVVYQCPFCFIRNCLPDQSVDTILFAGFLSPTFDKTYFSFQLQWPIQILNQSTQIQIRSVRFNTSNRFQLTWPQFCEIEIDKKQLSSIKPLPLNSPLKKRVDNPISIPLENLKAKSKICINQYFCNNNSPSWHLVAICKIQKNEQDQIFFNLSQQNIELHDSLAHVKTLMGKKVDDVAVGGVTIFNKCQFYGNSIQYPSRSVMCISHIQPFDLRGFIYSSMKARSSSRKWKCPVCGARAYDSYFDLMLMKLFRMHQNVKQIFFDGEDLVEIYYEQQKEEVSSFESDEQMMKPVILDLCDMV